MTCPHRETTTVQWLYGEAPDEHVHHVAGCVECQEVADRFERVEAAVAGVRPALARRRIRPRWPGIAVTLLAASALLGVWRFAAEQMPSTERDGTMVDLVDESFDDDLEDLEDDLAWLSIELDVL
jgi:hypothetical protein